jgi:2-dehydro-3-deoxygalactonokinase
MNSAGSEPALIGLDWGTSSFRAYLIGADGGVISSVSAPEGILHVEGGNFEAAFQRLVGRWAAEHDVPVIASGMITSRNGWIETPYVGLPSGAAELAAAMTAHTLADGRKIHFVTGMTGTTSGAPDVMRGEETQIAGAVAAGGGSGVFVLPGTHSKWVAVEDGKITSFATFMTGDVFGAMRGHTILGTLMEDGEGSTDALLRGARASKDGGLGLLHSLFTARTLPLFGEMSKAQAADYLSGLLIGAEVQGARALAGGSDQVVLIGRGDLNTRYAQVLEVFGLKAVEAGDHIVARGHFEIAKAGGLLQ